jgi:hypothetical protein
MIQSMAKAEATRRSYGGRNLTTHSTEARVSRSDIVNLFVAVLNARSVNSSVGPLERSESMKDPRSAILDAYLDVEVALYHLIEVKHLAEGYSRITKRPRTAINLVQRKGFLGANYVSLFNDLLAARDEVRHSADFSPPTDAVERHVQMAAELVAELRRRAESSS